MADWTTISSLATAGGTLVLAAATFASVRSANGAARTAERALLAGMRPVLVQSRLDDPEQKISWVDGHWTRLAGGRAGVELGDDVIYLSMPLRNVGAGIAVLQAWHPWGQTDPNLAPPQRDGFRRQTRDIYVAPGDVGFWQGAIRERGDPAFDELAAAVDRRERLMVDLLYTDHEGGQSTISRFILWPTEHGDTWLSSVARHWHLDGPEPR